MQQQQMPQPQFTFEGGHLVMFHNEVTGLNWTDPNVNDKDRMQDLLSTCKHLSNAYDTAMNEASHDALYQVFRQIHSDTKDAERQVYNTMFKKGWYKLPVADAQSVADAFNKAVQLQSQLPFPSQLSQIAQQSTQSQSQGQMQ